MKIRAVIFDWAGTTVDFGCCGPVGAIRSAFQEAGIELSERDARKPMGLLKRDHIAAVLALSDIHSSWTERYGAAPSESDLDRLYERFIVLQDGELRNHAALIPGVLDTVSQLRSKGILIGSTTGYTRSMLAPVAKEAARQGYTPDSSVTPDEVGEGRPAAFMIMQNLVQLHVWPPSAVIKVGDTPVDIKEGRNAGVWSVGVAATGNGIAMKLEEFSQLAEAQRRDLIEASRKELQASGAHFVIDTLDELPDVIRSIGAIVPDLSPLVV